MTAEASQVTVSDSAHATDIQHQTRYRAVVEYDGTRFYGYQRQKESQLTVQGVLETALFKLAQSPITVRAAGRTDAGVHATGQVISFDFAAWRHGPTSLHRALNANLPADVAIRSLQLAAPDFHPRFDARRRGYVYTVLNQSVRSPLQRERAWLVRKPLDIGRMNEAAAHMIGIHDFATFGTPPQGNNTVRELFQAEWRRESDEHLTFHITATAFLKRMVRSVVGSLQLVGNGSWSVEDFVAAMDATDRSRSGPSAPPQGLVLAFVKYKDGNE